MADDSNRAARKVAAMKELIDRLVLKYGSLREAGAALDIDHQLLSTWRKKAPKQREFLEKFERIRKALDIDKSRMWGFITKELE